MTAPGQVLGSILRSAVGRGWGASALPGTGAGGLGIHLTADTLTGQGHTFPSFYVHGSSEKGVGIKGVARPGGLYGGLYTGVTGAPVTGREEGPLRESESFLGKLGGPIGEQMGDRIACDKVVRMRCRLVIPCDKCPSSLVDEILGMELLTTELFMGTCLPADKGGSEDASSCSR